MLSLVFLHRLLEKNQRVFFNSVSLVMCCCTVFCGRDSRSTPLSRTLREAQRWAHCGRVAGAQQAFVKERMTEGKLTAKEQEEEMPRQGDQKGTVRRALWAMWTARKNFGGCKYQRSRKT